MLSKSNKTKTTHRYKQKLNYMMVDLCKIKPYDNNAKKHPPWQVEQIAKSIKHFRCINPLIITKNYQIVAGHGRYQAAIKLGLKKVPAILVKHLSETQIKAYRIADNKTNLNTGFDENLLKIELAEIQDIDSSFDLKLTGHTTGELDVIFNTKYNIDEDEADIIPEPSDATIVKSGDVWSLGKHLLICSSALEASSYKTVMDDDKADAVFTDPPFNVPISGHVCGIGSIKHQEFKMASGEMSQEEFAKFLNEFYQASSKVQR